jgi:hypothetical protein
VYDGDRKIGKVVLISCTHKENVELILLDTSFRETCVINK